MKNIYFLKLMKVLDELRYESSCGIDYTKRE